MTLGDNDTALVLNDDLTLRTGSGALTINGAVSGAHDLILNSTGATTFAKAVDAVSLTTNAGGTVVIQGGRISTTGAQTYGEEVLLDNSVAANGNPARTTVLNTSSGNVTFSGKLNNFTAGTAESIQFNTAAGAVMFSESIGDAGKLGDVIINSTGATTFTKAVDAVSLTTNAGGTLDINGGRITTLGSQSYGEAASLGDNTTLVSTAAGDIRFANTLNGAYSLVIDTTGDTLFGAAVGNSAALSSIDVTGDLRANGASVSTTGLQTYTGLVTMGRDVSFTSSQHTVNFLRISDAGANHDLDLNSFKTQFSTVSKPKH
jgi:hypothetical protein